MQPFGDVEDIVDQLKAILNPPIAKPLPSPTVKIVSVSSDSLSEASQQYARRLLEKLQAGEFFLTRDKRWFAA